MGRLIEWFVELLRKLTGKGEVIGSAEAAPTDAPSTEPSESQQTEAATEETAQETVSEQAEQETVSETEAESDLAEQETAAEMEVDMGIIGVEQEAGYGAIAIPIEEDDAFPETVETVAIAETEAVLISEEVSATEETTAETVMVESPTFWGGFVDGGWIYASIAFGIALLIGLICRLCAHLRRPRKVRHADKKKAAVAPQKPAAAPAEQIVTQTVSLKETPAAESAPVPSEGSGIRSAVFQDIGSRNDQQDSYGMTDPKLYREQGVLALVADGMGGLANGKAVSAELVNTFLGGFSSASGYEKTQDILLDLATRANYRINELFRNADRSGSTLVSVMIRNGYLNFLTVGDSRIYLYRAGAMIQLNREHIYQEELAVKALNRQIAIGHVATDRQAHALTSFFGIGMIPYMDRNDVGIKLQPGDRILLCSDGVFGTLTQEQMEHAMQHNVKDAANLMRDMIRAAEKPYQDNNTGLILEYLG